MTLIPDFELGVWNAWIVMAVFYVTAFLPFFLAGEKADARMEGEPTFREIGLGARVGMFVTHLVLMPTTLVYCIFVPLEQGNWWLYSAVLEAARQRLLILSLGSMMSPAAVLLLTG